MSRITTDFESSNIGAWAMDGPRCLRFEAPTNGAPWAMWFYFRLEHAEAGLFEFIVTNLLECLEATHWGDTRPVMRALDGPWVRADDDSVWLDLAAGEFHFRFDLPGGPVEIAYCYPYPPSLLNALFQELKQHPGVEVSYPGKSAGGRPVPYIVMRCTDSRRAPEVIWANAREHAGETSGGYALDGFMRAVVASPLREQYEIHILPMVDIDGVTEGRYGKCAPPVDHYMCWCPDTPRPEVALAMQLMDDCVASGKGFRMFLDFHSPSPERDSYLPPFNPTLLTPDQRIDAERLQNALVTHSPSNFPISSDEMAYQRVCSWFGDDIEHRPEAFVLRRFGADTCLIETTYHTSCNGTPSNPAIFRQYGASIARGLEKYLSGKSPGHIGIYDSMPPVFNRNHSWVLWSVPYHVRIELEPDHAWAVADAPASECYLGLPHLYPVEELDTIRIQYAGGGECEVVWCCYDGQSRRLLETPAPQVVQPAADMQSLSLICQLPASTEYVRPSFRLRGAFRPIQIRI